MVKKETLFQFSKFAIVGIINTLTNLVVLFILTNFFEVYYIVSGFFAFLVAVTNSFILNSLWTFNHKIFHKSKEKYSKFLIISTGALAVNLILLYSFTEFLNLYYMFSQIIAIIFSLWINFLGNKFWTFSGDEAT